jgi:PAT family beta-lactamase induction signal transducer AmpG
MQFVHDFREIIRPLLQRNMLVCLLIGFSSGLPLWLILNLLPAWLADSGVSLKTIGAMSLIMLPYTWKFLWAPLMDRYRMPLGRRRGWMWITQILLLVMMALYGFMEPRTHMQWIVLVSVVVAFLSATQDVAIDAYRRELLSDAEMGLGNALHVNAYKIASLVPGSLALILSDHLAWKWVFIVTAIFMLPGFFTSLLVSEPKQERLPVSLRAATVDPVTEFLSRHSVRSALYILLFTLCYKLGDSMATALATPFYLEMGYSKTQIGEVAKVAGLSASILGGLVGGLWMIRLGITRALWIFGVAQAVTVLGFALLTKSDHTMGMLAGVIAAEAFGTGMGTTAFVAFIASMTDRRYSATQFALLSSLAAVPRSFLNAGSGWLVESFGWFDFYLLCTALTLPGMLLLIKVAPWPSGQKDS